MYSFSIIAEKERRPAFHAHGATDKNERKNGVHDIARV